MDVVHLFLLPLIPKRFMVQYLLEKKIQEFERMYSKYGKRLIDFLISLLGFIVLSPLFLILCLLIKITSKGPIFFKQKRVGIHKTYF